MATSSPVKPSQFPRTKQQAQSVLRQLGLTGLKVDKIEDDRIFVLTRPKLQLDGFMRREARTVVFEYVGDEVIVRDVLGWIID